ncbi:hypothetical protein [Methylovulum psychrotolerans]|nr:hypothetical protein [Methylovulum psychrotolerans]
MLTNIDGNAPVTCSKSLLINATPAQVWAVLTAINQWPDWQRY